MIFVCKFCKWRAPCKTASAEGQPSLRNEIINNDNNNNNTLHNYDTAEIMLRDASFFFGTVGCRS